MFTGIVKEIGQVSEVRANREGRLLTFKAPKLFPQMEIDDSVAVNGTCQTIVSLKNDHFTVQAIETTLNKTSLGSLRVNQCVNLELALAVGDRLGGHFVLGHVDQTLPLSDIQVLGRSKTYWFSLSDSYRSMVIPQGSITLDGVSLTISNVGPVKFSVSLIPHSLEKTTLGDKRRGDLINVEFDYLAKYLGQIARQNMSKLG